MGFPTGAQGLSELAMVCTAETKAAKQVIAQVRACLTEQENKVARLENFGQVLTALDKSWKEHDPGKRDNAYFFLDQEGKWAVVKELIPDGTKVIENWREWREYDTSERWWRPLELVSPRYRAIPLSEVLRGSCPVGHSGQPVVEHYVQAFDGPEGDSWLKERMVVCADCRNISLSEAQISSERMR